MKDFSPTAEEARQLDWSQEAAAVMDRTLFIDFLEATNSPALFSRSLIEKLVDQAEKDGMPFKEDQGQRYYHRNHSWNWLFYNLDAFYQPCSLGSHQAREVLGLTSKDRGQDACCALAKEARRPELAKVLPRKVRWTVDYRLDLGEGPSSYPTLAGLPVPANVESQTDIEFLGMWDGENRLAPEVGKEFLLLRDVPVAGRASLTLRYAFRLVKSEIRAHGFPRNPKIPDLTLPLPTFIEELRKVSPEPYDRAWGLYQWMMDHSSYFRGANPDPTTDGASARYLGRKGGDCFFLSRAFVGFAAQLGLKSRPVYGPAAMHCEASNPRVQRFALAGGSVMSHGWIECEIPGIGWLPVDLSAVAFGGPSMNSSNCTDAECRAIFEREHRYLRHFLFGHSDSIRIQVSPRVMGAPDILQVRKDAPSPHGATLFPRQKLWSRVQLAPEEENHD